METRTVHVRPVSSNHRSHHRPSRGPLGRAFSHTSRVGRSLAGRTASLLPLLLVGIALILLQLTFLGKSLLFTLPSYGLIAVAVVISFVRLRSGPAPDRTCLGVTALFAGYVAVRALTSPAAYLARTDLFCILAAVALYTVCLTTIRSSSRRIALLVLLFAFAIYHIFLGLAQFGAGQNLIAIPLLERFAVTRRASGLYANPDHFAGLLEVLGIFALSIACWSRLPKLTRGIIGYIALACYIGLALTGSRGGYLSTVGSLVVFGILSGICLRAGESDDPDFRRYRNVAILIALFAVIGATLWIQQSPNVRQRIASMVEPDQTRFELWNAAITQWKLAPFIGTGSGTYRFYGREFRAPRMQADPVVVHNDYLQLLCEYGILGAILFFLFFGTHLRLGWKTFVRYGPQRLAAGSRPRSDRLALTIGALSALAACTVHATLDFNQHVPANALLIALVFAILADPSRLTAPPVEETASSFAPFGFRLAGAVAGVLVFVACVRILPGEYFAERARVALGNENPAEAVALATKALAYEQKNPNIYFYLGRGLRALGDDKLQSEKRLSYYQAAIGAFDRARQLAPLDGSYPLDLGFAYDAIGRFNEAEWMYDVALARDPNSTVMAHLYRMHLALWQSFGTRTLAADSARQ